MEKTDFKTVDQYIQSFPEDVRITLEKIRKTIKKAAPEAKEELSWQMPAFRLHDRFVNYAAFNHHYSLFIKSKNVLEAFKKDLKPYYVHKATVQFQKSEPIPFDLIAKMME